MSDIGLAKHGLRSCSTDSTDAWLGYVHLKAYSGASLEERRAWWIILKWCFVDRALREVRVNRAAHEVRVNRAVHGVDRAVHGVRVIALCAK